MSLRLGLNMGKKRKERWRRESFWILVISTLTLAVVIFTAVRPYFGGSELSREILVIGFDTYDFHLRGTIGNRNSWVLRIPSEDTAGVVIIDIAVKNTGDEPATEVSVVQVSSDFSCEFMSGEVKADGMVLPKGENVSCCDWGPLVAGRSFEYETRWWIHLIPLREIWARGESVRITSAIYSTEKTIIDDIEIQPIID